MSPGFSKKKKNSSSYLNTAWNNITMTSSVTWICSEISSGLQKSTNNLTCTYDKFKSCIAYLQCARLPQGSPQPLVFYKCKYSSFSPWAFHRSTHPSIHLSICWFIESFVSIVCPSWWFLTMLCDGCISCRLAQCSFWHLDVRRF